MTARDILRFGIILTLSVTAAQATFALPQQSTGTEAARTTSQDERLQWVELRRRFMDGKYQSALNGILWSVTHAYESKESVERFFELLKPLTEALQADDPGLLKNIGGIRGFKQSVATLANSNDDAVSGGAAIMLGVCGDQDYAADLSRLLKKKDPSDPDPQEYHHPTTIRGRAATALGLLGAKQYAPEVASLLSSRNEYDRAGAAIGLGYLADRSYGKAVARLLEDTNEFHGVSESAITSLLLMGAGAEYADKIAGVLRNSSQGIGGPAETAAYALAVVGAKEYARDIGALLKVKPARGYAAKALAVMGATQYAEEIASLLGVRDLLEREAAALSLGILGATKYAGALSKLLTDSDESVRYGAAVALVLMKVHDYDSVAIPIIEKFHGQGYHLNEADFHPVAHDRFVAIKARFDESLAQIKKEK